MTANPLKHPGFLFPDTSQGNIRKAPDIPAELQLLKGAPSAPNRFPPPRDTNWWHRTEDSGFVATKVRLSFRALSSLGKPWAGVHPESDAENLPGVELALEANFLHS